MSKVQGHNKNLESLEDIREPGVALFDLSEKIIP